MTATRQGARVSAILLDIEGTTTPISFVHDVLFPFARAHVKEYLVVQFDSAETISDLAQLRDEHAADVEHDREPPPLIESPRGAAIDSFAVYIHWLIDRDRKSPGLKSLQGRIWEQGYQDGTLTAPLFPDVLPAIENARRKGIKIAIFSSGSVLAQRLLFGHTDVGDITPLIDHYFNTTTGPKTANASYGLIAIALAVSPAELLFISDVSRELDAARAAGLQTMLCIRPGNAEQASSGHDIVYDFAGLAEIL